MLNTVLFQNNRPVCNTSVTLDVVVIKIYVYVNSAMTSKPTATPPTRECVCPARACGHVWQDPKALCRKCAHYEWSSDDNGQRSATNDYIIIVDVAVFVDTAEIAVVIAVTFSRHSGCRFYFTAICNYHRTLVVHSIITSGLRR